MLNRQCLYFLIFTIILVSIALIMAGSFSRKDPEIAADTLNSSTWNDTDTLQDKEALLQFRNIIQPEELYLSYMEEDSFLIDWIQDSDYDLRKAAVKLRKTLAWRLKNNIDDILKEDYSDIQKYCPYFVTGRDINQNVVGMMPFGSCKLRKLGMTGKLQRFKRYMLSEIEKMTFLARDLRRKTGKHIQGVGVGDFKGFSILEQGCVKCIPLLTSQFTVYQDHYPGYIKNWYFINVSRTAQRLFNFIIPLFSLKMKEITHIYGEKSEWKPVLLKTIPADQLPLLSTADKLESEP